MGSYLYCGSLEMEWGREWGGIYTTRDADRLKDTERQAGRKAGGQRDRLQYRQTDRQTDRVIQKDRHKERKKEGDREISGASKSLCLKILRVRKRERNIYRQQKPARQPVRQCRRQPDNERKTRIERDERLPS